VRVSTHGRTRLSLLPPQAIVNAAWDAAQRTPQSVPARGGRLDVRHHQDRHGSAGRL